MLIKLVWSLCATQEMENPHVMCLPMLKELFSTPRDINITSQEIYDLNQIIAYIELMIEKKHWPAHIREWVPQQVVEKCEEVCKYIDKENYKAEISEISQFFSEKGVDVISGAYVKRMLKPDIIITSKNAIIKLHKGDIYNKDKELRGDEKMKLLEAENFRHFFININEWAKMDEKKKKSYIDALIKSLQSQ